VAPVTGCAVQGCTTEAGRNGVACHDHFVHLVPGFLAAAYFRERDTFTRDFYRRQIVQAVNELEWTP
jgi:hypothetical protein